MLHLQLHLNMFLLFLITRWFHSFLTKISETWSSPMVQLVKNLPEMQEIQEMWVQSLGGEEPLKEEMATHSSVLENSMDRRAWRGLLSAHEVTKSQTRLSDLHTHFKNFITIVFHVNFVPYSKLWMWWDLGGGGVSLWDRELGRLKDGIAKKLMVDLWPHPWFHIQTLPPSSCSKW